MSLAPMPGGVESRLPAADRYELCQLYAARAAALADAGAPPRGLAARGLVTSVYDRAIVSSWVLFSELARLGVGLPVEAWHRPGELSPANRNLLASLPLALTIRELRDDVSGFAVKPVALWRSAFREALWIDADNAPLRDPAFLFDDPDYVAKGSLFWRDTTGSERARTWHPNSPVWAAFGVPANDAEEFEAGQLLVDKVRCWPEVCLTAHYAFNAAVYYSIVLGDKDTFRLAWQRVAHERGRPFPAAWYHADPASAPYGMMPYGPFHVGRPNRWGAWGGGSVLLQRDRAGQPLFHHRNMDKFTLEAPNPFNADNPNERIYHGHLAALARLRAPAVAPAIPQTVASAIASGSSLPCAWEARPEAPCAWGDLFDRLSILDLKAEHLPPGQARDNVLRERDALLVAAGDCARFPGALGPLLAELAAVNAVLWTVEDDLRACESDGRFDDRFVRLARSVYRENDRRAEVKRGINTLLGSALVEEKVFRRADIG